MKTFSVKQLAEMLGTNPETVRRWIREKKLKAVQVSRKDGNVITDDELQRFLKASPKYMPRYTASMAALNPAIGIPVLLAGLLGGKLAGYLDEKSKLDLLIRSADIASFLSESIAQHKDSIKQKKASVKQIEKEIQAEEQKLAQLQYLLTNKDTILEQSDSRLLEDKDDQKGEKQ